LLLPVEAVFVVPSFVFEFSTVALEVSAVAAVF